MHGRLQPPPFPLSQMILACHTVNYKYAVAKQNFVLCQCIFQFTYTSGNNVGRGPQSAEAQTTDCLNTKAEKMGCGAQETFRGCADICIGPTCPRDKCAKAGQTGGPAALPLPELLSPPKPVKPKPPVVKPTPPPVRPQPGPPPSFSPGQRCLFAGIKEQYFSQPGDFYCRILCLNKEAKLCYNYLCYCRQSKPRELEAITLNIIERQ